MPDISITYQGQLRCEATHTPSQNKLVTDAPVDNNGKGESFSPTDLVATGLGACMATIMGILAERKKFSIDGMHIRVQKIMSSGAPRRIVELPVTITMPLPEGTEHKATIENAAHTCPVFNSLHPDIKVPIQWIWKG